MYLCEPAPPVEKAAAILCFDCRLCIPAIMGVNLNIKGFCVPVTRMTIVLLKHASDFPVVRSLDGIVI
jgi:hypothetical protein